MTAVCAFTCLFYVCVLLAFRSVPCACLVPGVTRVSALGPHELELQVVEHVGTEYRSSPRVVGALNHGAVSPALKCFHLLIFFRARVTAMALCGGERIPFQELSAPAV